MPIPLPSSKTKQAMSWSYRTLTATGCCALVCAALLFASANASSEIFMKLSSCAAHGVCKPVAFTVNVNVKTVAPAEAGTHTEAMTPAQHGFAPVRERRDGDTLEKSWHLLPNRNAESSITRQSSRGPRAAARSARRCSTLRYICIAPTVRRATSSFWRGPKVSASKAGGICRQLGTRRL